MSLALLIVKPFAQVDLNSPRSQNDLSKLNELIRLVNGFDKKNYEKLAGKLSLLSAFVNEFFLHKLKLQVTQKLEITSLVINPDRIAIGIPVEDKEKKVADKVKSFLHKRKITYSVSLKTSKKIIVHNNQTYIFLNPKNMVKLLNLIKRDIYTEKTSKIGNGSKSEP